MSLTGAQLGKIIGAIPYALGRQIASLDDLAAGANEAMRLAGVKSLNQAAGFLSQTIQESAYLRTTEEYGKGAGYAYAPYCGRTFMQVTWRGNYAKFGAWCVSRGITDPDAVKVTDPSVFVKYPGGLANPRYAWLGAVWYFTADHGWGKTLIEIADGGSCLQVSNGVNRGNPWNPNPPNGYRARLALWNAVLAQGPSILPDPPKPPPSASLDVRALQTRLRAASCTGRDRKPLVVDGVYGDNTAYALGNYVNHLRKQWAKPGKPITPYATAATLRPGAPYSLYVLTLQWKVGADTDGRWGPETTRKLNAALAADKF